MTMARFITILSLTWWATAALAEHVVREVAWTEAWRGKPTSTATAGYQTCVSGDSLVVDKKTPDAQTITVLTLDGNGITRPVYALTGRIRWEGVEGDGYVEMWNVFGPGKRYFSRALPADAPVEALWIKGSSDWRAIVLVFNNREGAPAPKELELNVVLPGRGKVWLGPLRLVQYEAGENPWIAAQGAGRRWWTDQWSGLIGGTLGSLLGCMGGLIGWLTAKGKARNAVMGMLRAMQIVGVAGLGVGGVALAVSQPYGVYYPLLLIGVLCAVLPMGLIGSVRRRYAEMELRKMSAMDVG